MLPLERRAKLAMTSQAIFSTTKPSSLNRVHTRGLVAIRSRTLPQFRLLALGERATKRLLRTRESRRGRYVDSSPELRFTLFPSNVRVDVSLPKPPTPTALLRTNIDGERQSHSAHSGTSWSGEVMNETGGGDLFAVGSRRALRNQSRRSEYVQRRIFPSDRFCAQRPSRVSLD